MKSVIEAYKRDVDRTLLIENLRLTTQQRSEKFERAMKLIFELQRFAQKNSQASRESNGASQTS